MLTIMAGLAEFERSLIQERIKSGVSNARAKGKVFGRKPGSKADKYRNDIKLLSDEGKSIRAMATIPYRHCRGTPYRRPLHNDYRNKVLPHIIETAPTSEGEGCFDRKTVTSSAFAKRLR
jgi:DNA invertase Pin-like site-specific DNA recombinase